MDTRLFSDMDTTHTAGPRLGSRPRRLTRHLIALVAALLGLTGTLLGASPPASAGPTVDLTPGEYPRGPETSVPHVTRSTIIHGDVRLRLPWAQVDLLGMSGNRYIAAVGAADGSGAQVVRVAPDGRRHVLMRGGLAWWSMLDTDGTRLVTANDARHTTVTVRSAVSGAVQTSRGFRSLLNLLDVDHGRIALGGWAPDRTQIWNVPGHSLRTLRNRPGNAADLSSNRFGYYTGDPYEGGCSVVAAVSAPGAALWRSCGERPEVFSPSGDRMLTVGILSDGPGPNRVVERGIRGGHVATYRSTLFGELAWHPGVGKLLEAHGPANKALMNCAGQECFRASALEPSRLR